MSYETLLELFRLHGFYLFCEGTFHGDLHPGNVLLADGRICFIDTGFIGNAGPAMRRGLFDFFAALCEFEFPACAAALHRVSQRQLDRRAFAAFSGEFSALYAGFEGSTVSRVSLTQMMTRTIRLAVRFGMSFDKSLFPVIRSLMYLDGMVLRCNPDAVLMRDMRPFFREFDAAARGGRVVPCGASRQSDET
jgi:ubiquinone biosynthesis protein